jgi:phosphoribosylglycinamide formyltransferase 1
MTADIQISARIAVLISGRGSNMVALIKAVADGRIPNAEIAVVVSDQSSAPGLLKAKENGVETVVIERRGRSREDHDREIVRELKLRRVDLVCLAGYMRVLSRKFLDAFPRRILNIHPSLLPAFPGLHAQQQALDGGVKFSGCTVHFVDQSLDGGPIIAQRAVEVRDDDDEGSLSERILVEEHKLYPEAVARVVKELNVKAEGVYYLARRNPPGNN